VFWKDLERHHPGIDSLHLSSEVATAWKQRLRTRPKTFIAGTGNKQVIAVERIGDRQCLTPVRAFYLDLAQWAIEDPARWGRWVAPCPVGEEEINQRKAARRRKARMDARTRERLPVLAVLVRTIDQRRKTAAALLTAARQTRPGDWLTIHGQTLTRSILTRPTDKIWVDDPNTGNRRDLGMEEDLAFWAWATVEVLRATGVRIEELTELSHHSLVQYRLPPPASWCRCCKSPPARPTPNDSWSSAPNSPRCCRPSSAASATPPARSLSSAPTTDANASGWLHPHGCSNADSAPSTAGSAKAPSATCSTPRWSTPA
jgi:hypothetical protein